MHVIDMSQLTAKAVKTIDSNIDNTLSSTNKVTAQDIASVNSINLVTDSEIVAICILF